MHIISPDLPNRVYLEDLNIADNSYTVTYSLRNEMGEFVKDKANNEIKNVAAKIETKEKKFFADLELATDARGKYVRLEFVIKKGNLFVPSSAALIDLIIDKGAKQVELVPISYLKDYALNSNLNSKLKTAIANYKDDGFREKIASAHSYLETQLEMSLYPVTKMEKHDWFKDNMKETFWMVQLYEWPIISVQSYKLYYGVEEILEIPAEYLQLNKEMGIVEYLPTGDQPFFMIFYNVGVEATQFSLFSRGLGSERLPNVFHITYTHGLDFYNLTDSQQSEIRDAISRRALVSLLPRLDPDTLIASHSTSVDGMSHSKTNRGLDWINGAKQDEAEWIRVFKRKYNKNSKMQMV